MNRIFDFIKEFWPSMLTLAVILYATLDSQPIEEDMMLPIPYLDKWIHAIMMGGLVGAIAFDLQRHHKEKPKYLTTKLMWTIWIGVVIFGGVDELAQSWMDNGRGSEWLDFLADCVGATVAVFAAPPVIRTVLRINSF